MTFQRRAFELINQARSGRNIPPLQRSSALDAVAQDLEFTGCGGGLSVRGRCLDMGARHYFEHKIKDCNHGFSSMLTAAGITLTGPSAENLGFVNAIDNENQAAENIHSQFMAEPENVPTNHKGNLLNRTFTHVGIGVWRTGPGETWRGLGGPLARAFVTCQIFATNPSPLALPGAGYHPVSPNRILDTRFGSGNPAHGIGPGATRTVQVTGTPGVPASGVSAVVMNVTVAEPTSAGFLTVFPAGEPRPLASNLNFTPGLIVPNLVAVKLGVGGQVSIFNSAGNTHAIADVAGWFDSPAAPTGSQYHPVTPARILDTRSGAPAGPGATIDLPVLNLGGVPATGVSAVAVTVTAVGPTSAGFLTVFPTGEGRPNASNLNFTAGRLVANLVVAKTGAGGSISIFNSAGNTHVVVDVTGWFDQGSGPGGSRYHAVTPSRILDTRAGGTLGPGSTHDLQVAGQGGVPGSGATAVVMNVTVVDPTAASSFLTVFPTGEPRPNASNLVYTAGQIVPDLVVAKLGAGGRVSIFNQVGTVNVVADVAGWFGSG